MAVDALQKAGNVVKLVSIFPKHENKTLTVELIALSTCPELRKITKISNHHFILIDRESEEPDVLKWSRYGEEHEDLV